jgi:pimeloyl-ACP methyl ester carboxylesterase
MGAEKKSAGSSAMSGSAERRKRVVPLSFQLAGMTLNLISVVHNEWASDVLTKLWFTVFKSSSKPWVAEFWAGADDCIEISVGEWVIPVYCWGQGPLVVTMHGWSGSGTQFRHFISPLVAAGFRVACFDAPAHGSNPGRQTHLVDFSASLIAIQNQLGKVDSVIAHSLGAMATVYATQLGLSIDRLLLVAPHLNVQKMFETYRDLLGMRPALADRFHARIGAKMEAILDHRDPWEILVPEKMLQACNLPGMLVHDHNDPEVAQAQFDEIAGFWEKSQLLVTQGLGHNRILKDERVINAVTDYLKA